MSSRSNWEGKSVLNRLDPSRRAEAEARAAAKAARPVNEAIQAPTAPTKPSSTQGLTSHQLGSGMAAKASRAYKAGSTNRMPDEAK